MLGLKDAVGDRKASCKGVNMKVREFPGLEGGAGWTSKGVRTVEGSGPYTGQNVQIIDKYS